jgi:hypothetical protein
MTAAHSSSGSRAQERRKIPASQSSRRSRLVVSAATTVVAVIGLIPLLLALLGIRADGLAFVLGAAAGLGTIAVRALSNARGKRRLLTQTGRYLTAWTWTGPRTIDLQELRSVQARRISGRIWPPLDYVIVRDSAGVRMAFCTPPDFKLIRTAVADSQPQPPPAIAPQVSLLAKAVLGISRLPRGLSFLWALGSAELPIAVMFAFIVPALLLSAR